MGVGLTSTTAVFAELVRNWVSPIGANETLARFNSGTAATSPSLENLTNNAKTKKPIAWSTGSHTLLTSSRAPHDGNKIWACLDSNQGPRDYESPALTAVLQARRRWRPVL
jgi:hypothetical protein